MSRPPKLTKLKPEENRPPLEAYVTDLITTPAMLIPASVENLTVTPANNNEDETGVTSAQCQIKKKRRQNDAADAGLLESQGRYQQPRNKQITNG